MSAKTQDFKATTPRKYTKRVKGTQASTDTLPVTPSQLLEANEQAASEQSELQSLRETFASEMTSLRIELMQNNELIETLRNEIQALRKSHSIEAKSEYRHCELARFLGYDYASLNYMVKTDLRFTPRRVSNGGKGRTYYTREQVQLMISEGKSKKHSSTFVLFE